MFRYLPRFTIRFTKLVHASQKFSTTIPVNQNKVAVILSGCGVFDGSEIHEAAATVVHLTRKNIEPYFFAPEIAQLHVINHVKGEPTCEVRCVLTEAARIARGSIRPLVQLHANDFQGLVFPGGFGAAKNLSTFSEMGAQCTVNLEVCRVITEFHKSRKPMALMCIAPVLVARIIPCVTITLGMKEDCKGSCQNKWPHQAAIDEAIAMGANVECKNIDEVSVDKENLIVSNPAFMYDGKFCEIYDGIGVLIAHLDCLIRGTR